MVVSLIPRINFPSIQLPPSALTVEAVIRVLTQHLAEQELLRAEHLEQVIARVLQREALGSTAIGHGVAIPHAKTDVVQRVEGVIGLASVPVRWPNALDHLLVERVCLIIGPPNQPAEYMRTMEVLVNQIRNGSPVGE